jgi:hypothetical protein
MSININYDDSVLTSKNETFFGEYQDYKISIDAHWNDWDNWVVDSVNFEDDVPEDFDQNAAISEIEEEFLNNMF